jgi:hypothetical protein
VGRSIEAAPEVVMYLGREVHTNGIGRQLGRPEVWLKDQTSAAGSWGESHRTV